jgi:hypothetical protein
MSRMQKQKRSMFFMDFLLGNAWTRRYSVTFVSAAAMSLAAASEHSECKSPTSCIGREKWGARPTLPGMKPCR